MVRERPEPAFSLIEVVIVIVILALIAAIAIPRLSRGSQGSAEAATVKNAALLQKAIDLYAAEHNGAFPNPMLIGEQLTLYSDAAGTVSKTRSGAHPFGPYVRKVPAVLTGPNKGSSGIGTAPGNGVGWVYNHAEGAITANTGDAAAATNPPTLPSDTDTPITPVPPVSPVN